MLNLTPHAIVIISNGQEITLPPSGTVARVEIRAITLPPSGTVARVEVRAVELGFVEVEGVEVSLVKDEYGSVVGLPTTGENCIVSGMVMSALQANPRAAEVDLTTVFAPDTGSTAIRNDKGHIVGVTRLKGAI